MRVRHPICLPLKDKNWSLPTYNWEAMKNTGFKWWKQRFEQMTNYFDTFRIDHILGFFRIWEIPANQVEGIMGHLNPSIPIYVNEFGEKGIGFDYNRFANHTSPIRFYGISLAEAGWAAIACRWKDGWILRLKPEFQSQKYVEKLYKDGKIF